MPIVNKAGARIGVTQVLNKRGGAFTAKDEARLRAFTAQIAVSLENAQLFDDVLNMKNYNESILKSTSNRSEEHTSELQSLMRISYAVFCLKKKKKTEPTKNNTHSNHIIHKLKQRKTQNNNSISYRGTDEMIRNYNRDKNE